VKAQRLIIVIFLYLCTALLPSFGESEEKEESKYFELENGMKVFLYERHTLPLLNVVLGFNVGTKDESQDTNGLVHILEHYILFRGTEFRSGTEIAQDIRAHGAYFNGHTGRDLATFEMTLPSEYADFALHNQKEILFHLKLSQEELDKEKQVILEELSQIRDDPMKYATTLAYQSLFQNHPYQKPVHGQEDIIKNATVEQVEKFYKKYFVPENCALAVVGDFSLGEMEKKIKSEFGDLKNSGFVTQGFPEVTPLEKTAELEEEMDVNIAYLLIGMKGPNYNNEDQYSVDILTQVLGRGVYPLLYNPIRGRRELAESVFMTYASHKYGGAMFIYITLDPKNLKAAEREMIRYLKTARNLNYSKSDYQGDDRFYALDYLESAKNQIKFNFDQSQEKGLTLALALTRYILMTGGQKRGRYLDQIDKVSSSDLRRAAGQYLSKEKYVVVSIFPKNKK
jgi:predicted Zn-dependent peptidase